MSAPIPVLESPAQDTHPSLGGWGLFVVGFRDFLSRPMNLFSFVLMVLLLLAALMAPLLAPYAYDVVNPSNGLAPPSFEHLMGTDQAGRDVFSRVLYGARVSLSIGIVTVAFGLVLGVLIGLVSGYLGGYWDEIIMRIVEVFMSLPGIVSALALVAVLGPSPPAIVLALSIRRITQFARVTRGAVLSIRGLDYVTACRAVGIGHLSIMFRHILPNCFGPIVVLATVLMGNVILVESTLSFLGMGIQEPVPSWGGMIAKGNDYLTFAPWVSLFPGFCLFLTMLAFNLLGDGVRDYFDPRGGGVN